MATKAANLKLIKTVVGRVFLEGESYRSAVHDYINKEFMEFVMNFFPQIVAAKMRNEEITEDWYKKEMMNEKMKKEEIAINGGMNAKTIENIHGTERKEVVIQAAYQNYEDILNLIKSLLDQSNEVDLMLTIKFNKASVELNINESLIVINTLAVKRAAISGGAWSFAGKNSEKPIMLTLCKLFSVAPENYDIRQKKSDKVGSVSRQIDFFLVSENKRNKCELKLMGKGNPEGADVVHARDTDVFVADTLSETNIKQLNDKGIEWIHLGAKAGYRRFSVVLKNLGIPHKKYSGKNLKADIHRIVGEIMEK